MCEAVSHHWGLLPPSFCLASQTRNADFYRDLTACVKAVLRKYMYVRDPAEGPLALSGSEHQQCEFAKELLHLCYVNTRTDDAARDEENAEQNRSKRSQTADAFISFFPSAMGWCDDTQLPTRVLRRKRLSRPRGLFEQRHRVSYEGRHSKDEPSCSQQIHENVPCMFANVSHVSFLYSDAKSSAVVDSGDSW